MDTHSICDIIRSSGFFPNHNSDREKEQPWEYQCSKTKVVEETETQSTSLIVGGKLAPSLKIMEVQGSVGELSLSHETRSEVVARNMESNMDSNKFEYVLRIPPKKKMAAEYVKITKKFRCKVEGLTVTYDPNDKVKCTKEGKTKPRKLSKIVEVTDECKATKKFFHTIKNEVQVSAANYEWEESIFEIRENIQNVT